MDVVTEASKLPGLIEYSVSKSDEKRSEVFSRQVNIKSNMRAANGVVKIAPHAGKDFVLLSSGHAEDVLGGVNSSDDSFESKGIIPAAYRKIHNGVLQTHPLCESGGGNIFDTVRLHLKMRAPKTARGIQFDFRFFSREYPYYMCSMFNDFFLALLTDANGRPIVDKDGDGEVLDEDANISFDALGNPISVNNATFTTCAAPKCGSSFFSESAYCPANLTCSNNHCGSCEDGYDAVKAYYPNPYTGLGSSFEFGDSRGGGTAWLTTKAPIKPGEVFNLDFYIWDTGDSVFDSSVILDNFQWICTDTEISTEIVCEKEQ